VSSRYQNAFQAVQASSSETNVKRAAVVKPRSDEGMDKRSSGSAGEAPGNLYNLLQK